MRILILLLQQQGNYEDWGTKSLLIGAIIAMSGVIIYLYKSKESTIKEKDQLIMKVVKEHQDDLKVGTQDMKILAENYFKFTQTIKELVNGTK